MIYWLEKPWLGCQTESWILWAFKPRPYAGSTHKSEPEKRMLLLQSLKISGVLQYGVMGFWECDLVPLKTTSQNGCSRCRLVSELIGTDAFEASNKIEAFNDFVFGVDIRRGTRSRDEIYLLEIIRLSSTEIQSFVLCCESFLANRSYLQKHVRRPSRMHSYKICPRQIQLQNN